jgi:hypothetical protein
LGARPGLTSNRAGRGWEVVTVRILELVSDDRVVGGLAGKISKVEAWCRKSKDHLLFTKKSFDRKKSIKGHFNEFLPFSTSYNFCARNRS